MKKNLKKVISAIAALALSTSSFVALAANDFPDVAETAGYAKAVDQLTAMGIVEGYDDGTFKPDENVTRAQMTAMIIRALGSENAAQSMAGRDTAFRDVDHNHWAAGYVAVANTTNPQFIQGMGDGTFAPDATVTYAQAVTMLVRAVGYETLAAQQGYPNGYLSQASTIGILNGLAGVSNDTELNRGQVAILIDNAIVDAPILGEGDWQTNYLNGTGGYAPEAKDGVNPLNRDFWTTLATKQKVYKVYGMVTGTKQTDGIDFDEVKFEIQRTENFDGYSYGFGFNALLEEVIGNPITVNVGETDAANYLNQYAEALIKKTINDEYVILSYTVGGGRTGEISFDAKQFEGISNGSISYTDETGSKTSVKKLDSNVKFFVNDYPVEITETYTVDKFVNDYLTYNYVGDVTLLDYKGETATGADGKYDSVMVTYYEDAVVDEVVISNSGLATVRFLVNADGLGGNLQIDPDDEDRTVKFVGDATSYEDLEQYDVLSIQREPGASLNKSANVTATVARAEETGVVTKKGTDEITDSPLYTINGEEYITNKALIDETDVLATNAEYTIYLDAFGYIAYYVEGINYKNYGILDRVYDTNAGEYKVRLIKADGSVDTYDCSSKNFATYESYYTDGETVKPVWERVVSYDVTSSGELRIKKAETPLLGHDEYSLNTNRVQNVRMNDNTTALDLTKYYDSIKWVDDSLEVTGSGDASEVSVMGSFHEDTEYTVYGYGRSNSDNSYNFVIVLIGEGGIGIESPFAVVSTVSQGTYDGIETTQLSVYTNGELVDLLIDTDDSALSDKVYATYSTGDAFIYELGADNMITEIQKIYTIGATGTNEASYQDYVSKAFNAAYENADVKEGSAFDAVLEADVPTALTYESLGWKKSRDYAYFTFGPVIDTNTNSVTIGSLNSDGYTKLDVDTNYGFDSTYYVYAYNWNEKTARLRVTDGSRSSIVKTSIPNSVKNSTYEDGARYIDWAGIYGNPDETGYGATSINFALLKVNNGRDIAEGYRSPLWHLRCLGPEQNPHRGSHSICNRCKFPRFPPNKRPRGCPTSTGCRAPWSSCHMCGCQS